MHRTATSQKAQVSKLEIRSELLNLRLTALSVQPLARPMPRPKPACRYRRLQLNACADTRWCHIHQGASPVRFALDASSLGASAADLVVAIICEDEKGNQLQSLCDLPLQVEGFRFSKQLLRVARLKVLVLAALRIAKGIPFCSPANGSTCAHLVGASGSRCRTWRTMILLHVVFAPDFLAAACNEPATRVLQ